MQKKVNSQRTLMHTTAACKNKRAKKRHNHGQPKSPPSSQNEKVRQYLECWRRPNSPQICIHSCQAQTLATASFWPLFFHQHFLCSIFRHMKVRPKNLPLLGYVSFLLFGCDFFSL